MAGDVTTTAGLVALRPHPDHRIRRSARVVAALAELHKAGFQRLRAMPYMSASGAYWRFEIGPVDLFHQVHGAVAVSEYSLTHSDQRATKEIAQGVARYSSGQAEEGQFFGWEDAAGDGARELADKLLRRFPVLAAKGQGWDYVYAGWFQRLRGLVEAGFFPYAFADMQGPSRHGLYISSMRPSEWGKVSLRPELPLPPPGEYDGTLTLEDGRP
ncbi:hypothetical protein RQ846_20265 [Roseomonas mucosa]|uniref:hypothetical protein n=1 Tax=Roseomonas mucosa TaxID=207340 RepID=UPI0028CD5BDE|nr:hypothetical protein [Roseomonas mucosa]MDT8292051.1 hypothetical protein [Roseomonas mucosa]